MATKASAQTGVDLVNTLRSESPMLLASIPEATLQNIEDVGNPILTYSTTQNEFLTSLVNRISLVFVRMKIMRNNLSVLKQGVMPLGRDIQEIATNPAKDKGYDPDGADLLSREIPDVKSAYHRRNRQGKYKATISDSQLKEAFTSWDKFNELVAAITNSLYSGDNFDEFVLMKLTFGDALIQGKVNTSKVVAPMTDAVNFGREAVLALQNASSMMQFPGSDYNSYFLMANNPAVTPFVTATPIEDQIIVIRSDVKNQIGVDVLSAAFQFDQVNYRSRVLETDNFLYNTGTIGADGQPVLDPIPNLYAIVMDKSFPQIYDTLNEMRDQYNGSGLFRNMFWHHWQVYSLSPFANALYLTDNTDLPTPTTP